MPGKLLGCPLLLSLLWNRPISLLGPVVGDIDDVLLQKAEVHRHDEPGVIGGVAANAVPCNEALDHYSQPTRSIPRSKISQDGKSAKEELGENLNLNNDVGNRYSSILAEDV